jgi:cystathionine beta-synthase
MEDVGNIGVQVRPSARSFAQPELSRSRWTPLVELTGLDTGQCRILAKLENMNPTGSVKDRVAPHLIADAEREGRLKPGMTILEASSGNATIALGSICRSKGYKVIAYVPASMSQEKRRLHQSMGVEMRFFEPDPSRPFTNIRRDAAIELALTDPEKFITLDQFSAPANVNSHKEHTAVEIWHQLAELGGSIDRLFVGAGTGGALCGLGGGLIRNDRLPNMKITMVDPEGSILADVVRGEDPTAGQMKAPDGLGERFVPQNLDLTMVDDADVVARQDAVNSCGDLVAATGILGGPCTGYTLKSALDWCNNQTEPKTALVLVCDRGENYLSDPMFVEAIDKAYARASQGAGMLTGAPA